jgi:hypothetical protein
MADDNTTVTLDDVILQLIENNEANIRAIDQGVESWMELAQIRESLESIDRLMSMKSNDVDSSKVVPLESITDSILNPIHSLTNSIKDLRASIETLTNTHTTIIEREQLNELNKREEEIEDNVRDEKIKNHLADIAKNTKKDAAKKQKSDVRFTDLLKGALGLIALPLGELLGSIKVLSTGMALVGKAVGASSSIARVASVGGRAVGGVARMGGALIRSVGSSGIGRVATAGGRGILNVARATPVGRVASSAIGTVSQFSSLSSIAKIFPIALRLGKIIPGLSAAIDTVYGFFEGFTETMGGLPEKILAGLENAPRAMIEGFFGIFDSLKNWVIAPILDFFGADKLAETLKGFSIAELFSAMYDTASEFMSGIGEKLGDAIVFVMENGVGGTLKKLGGFISGYAQTAWEVVSTKVTELLTGMFDSVKSFAMGSVSYTTGMFKDILAAILPRIDPSKGRFAPLNMIATAIPDAVYKAAGITKTGESLNLESPKTNNLDIPNIAVRDVYRGEQMLQGDDSIADARSDASSAPIIIAPQSGGGTKGNGPTINSVSYSQSNLPDRSYGMQPSGTFAF